MFKENRKVSVVQLKEMFISEGENYTDEEVTMIHDFFYQLIHIEIEAIKQLTEEYWKKMDES